uniref:Crystallin beta-gamma domain containing 2 n=1 Tax=Varanus komodoensis TaxID=61221 RepID=A0A8D2J918_VARKO
MEKATGGSHSRQSKSRGAVASTSFKWKKAAPGPAKDNAKLPLCKAPALAQVAERAGVRARSKSPSKVSVLLEAWEKGLVGMDTASPSSSADTRRSRSPVHTRRLLASKESSHPLFPANSRSSLSSTNSSADSLGDPAWPADPRSCHSPVNARRSRSPADAHRSLFPVETRRSLSPAETRRSYSPVDARRALFSAETRRSHSPANSRSLSPADARQSLSLADHGQTLSPVETLRSCSPSYSRRSFSPVDARRSLFLAERKRSLSPADKRHCPLPGNSTQSFPPVENQWSLSPANARHSAFLANGQHPSSSAGAQCSPAESQHSSSPTDIQNASSLPDIKCSHSVADIRRFYSAADARCPNSPADTRHPFATADSRRSSSPAECRSSSPASVTRRSRSLSPRRDFTVHGPVFAQVYSPSSKPGRTEEQDTAKNITGAESQGENCSRDVPDTLLAVGSWKKSHIPSTNVSQEENLPPMAESPLEVESQMPSFSADTRSLSESHRVSAVGPQTQGSPGSTTLSCGSAGGTYTPTVPSTPPLGGSCGSSPKPGVLSSNIVAKSQIQWFGPTGSSMVVFRSEQQVVVPQAGRATIYRAGREVVMSRSEAENTSPVQPQALPALSTVSCIPPVKDWQHQGDLPDADALKGPPGSFCNTCDCCSAGQPQESCMTQSRNAGVGDAPKQRCMLVPNPPLTSNTETTTSREGIAPFNTPQRDCSPHRGLASQRHSSLSTAGRCEREPRVLSPDGPVATWSGQEGSLSRTEEAGASGSQSTWCSSDAAAEIGVFRTGAQEGEGAPGDQKVTSWAEPREEEKDLTEASPLFLPKPNASLAETTDSSCEPPHQKTESSNKMAEHDPEEVVEMELFVDTLRNMEPTELRKPLKLLPRPPRPSTLAKHAFLPPIHEDRIVPKSRVPLCKQQEEEMEEVENPYLSNDEKREETDPAGKSYPWENMSHKTEEDIGSFLGMLKQNPNHSEAKAIAPKAITNQANLIRANVLKGMSLLSGLVDKKSVEAAAPSPLATKLFQHPNPPITKAALSAPIFRPNCTLRHEMEDYLLALFSFRVQPGCRVPICSELAGSSSQPPLPHRPQIVLYSESNFEGQKREIWAHLFWVMYEKPRFHGRKCVLAEGDVQISNPWAMYHQDGAETENLPVHIGSLKRVVRDYKTPEISLFSEENGEALPVAHASLSLFHRWLVYSKPYFDDDPYVLEPGGYPNLQAWGAKDPSICSMHPIKLGCPVVEKPGEPKALVYEKPHFQGHSWEISRDIYNLKKPENNQDSKMPTAGSLKILGGCWVGYQKEGFRGHQYLLEEGEYCDWMQWGGYDEELVSLRLIRTGFLDPALLLSEAMDFEEGPSIELSEALPDVSLANYRSTTRSIHVLSGVWVAYEGKNFTGEQYILEKGVYHNCEDWGANNYQICSVQPVLQVREHSLHFISKIQLFSDPDFLGSSISFTEDQVSLPDNFILRSCRVSGGSWILYGDQQFNGEQHILSEGEYPTLTSMGCLFTTDIRSLKKVPIFFSEPSIFLHALECFEGKEIELNGEVRSLQADGFNNHVLSVRVKGGIWVLCEHSDFRGRQWLLGCVEITNWKTYSGLQHIGSLYPIRQKRIYFRIKNEELKSFLSVPDDVEDMKAGRVLVSELNDKSSSIWYYEEGLMKNQVAPNMSLQVIGPAAQGAKVVLWSESRVPRQTWRIDSFGRICSQMFEDKLLDVKGGRSYDRDHAILWDSAEERPTQMWSIQVL